MPVLIRLGICRGLRGRIVFMAVLVVLAAAYLSSPNGFGGLALFATAVTGLASFAVGPLMHRPVNRVPWYWLTASGALFLSGLLFRFGLITLPGLAGSADLWAFGGYACCVPFLRGLLRQTHSGPDPTLWLDTAAITTGSALIGWVMNVAPELSRSDPHLGVTVVNTMYPVMDSMLLALTVQLAFRRGSSAPSLQAAVAGMAALLLGDLAYTFLWAAHPGAVNPYLNVLYLVAYAYMGLMAAHPSMRELSDVDVPFAPQMSRARLVVIFLAMITPASIPIMRPTHGVLDAAMRAVIMSIFGTLVFLRLLGTIQALRRAEAEAQRRATHDVLTGLPNRVALLDGLEDHLSLVRAEQKQGWLSVLLIDCDHFKQVNASWGHAAGDEVLIRFADRLQSVIGVQGPLARIGGDEFVVRIDTDEPTQASAVARHVLAICNEPLSISAGRSTLLTTSIGIAQAPYVAPVTAEDLLRNADLALYEAKGAGRGTFAVYDSSMHERVARRHKLADSLHGALRRGEISVVFQPIRGGADFSTLIGWEALARWDHPEYGRISPLEFIPIAEDTGLIIEIGAFVARTAFVQLREWQHRYGRSNVHMSVNVSSVQILRGNVVELISQLLSETGLSPQCLWLEITESVVLERTEESLKVLNALASLGVKLCMDDFGTGYSSLSYLKDFTIHILKVDQAFIRTLERDQRDEEITKAMIDMAAALGLEGVVAEGVETQGQADSLLRLGCSLAQGYLFGRPVPPEQATLETDAQLGYTSGLTSAAGASPSQTSVTALPHPRPDHTATPDQSLR